MVPIQNFNMDYFSLKGKNAIITGGNSGLGQAFSVALAKAGANVMAASILADDETTGMEVKNCGAEYDYIEADLTREGECKRVVDACMARWGSVDILVNSAGICINMDDVTKFTRKEWDAMVSVNLTAAYEMAHEATKHMIAQRSGKVINIASLYSFLGGKGSLAYAATKHGIAGLTKAMCDEVGEYNIQVNGIAPGYFATKLTEKTRNDRELNEQIISRIPVRRWGDLVDLMGTCVFLASHASDYVNGHILTVDGGYLAR